MALTMTSTTMRHASFLVTAGYRNKTMINLRKSFSNKTSKSQLSDRRRGERADSVTPEILEERRQHLERIEQSLEDSKYGNEEDLILKFKKLGLGRKKVGSDQRRLQFSEIGGQGAATFLSSSTKPPWPRFKHMLPEIALAGHSNSGKSTLLNSLVGMTATRGPARVSDRAGWTDALFWYQVGSKPPKLSLVDLPGYGHAVASSRQMATWESSTKGYLETRRVLTRCCVLVDSTRGLCREDFDLLTFLMTCNISHQVVLTKGDLLTPLELARCFNLVNEDVFALKQELEPKLNTKRGKKRRRFRKEQSREVESDRDEVLTSSISPDDERDLIIKSTYPTMVVSGHTGAGVQMLWKELFDAAAEVSVKEGVPIHVNAVR